MVFCKLPVGPDRPQLPENCCRESFGNCLHASVRQSSRLANIKGEPTKRIVRTLTTESSGGSRLTHEKGLLNSRKNSHFCKTNHLGKGNNGGLGGLMEDLISIQITTFFCIYPQNDRSGRGPGNDTPIGRKFRGHYTNQACYKSAIMSQDANTHNPVFP